MGNENPVIKFTELLLGATARNLVFPCNNQFEGPFWLEDGSVIEYQSGQNSEATLRVVDLGRGKYRLAENPCFDDLTTLYWGDEFYASENKAGDLVITQIDLPLKFNHQTCIVGGSINLKSDFFQLILEQGGNWELIAGGILITSVPIVGSIHFKVAGAPMV
jgi:hypothetical protein